MLFGQLVPDFEYRHREPQNILSIFYSLIDPRGLTKVSFAQIKIGFQNEFDRFLLIEIEWEFSFHKKECHFELPNLQNIQSLSL